MERNTHKRRPEHLFFPLVEVRLGTQCETYELIVEYKSESVFLSVHLSVSTGPQKALRLDRRYLLYWLSIEAVTNRVWSQVDRISIALNINARYR